MRRPLPSTTPLNRIDFVKEHKVPRTSLRLDQYLPFLWPIDRSSSKRPFSERLRFLASKNALNNEAYKNMLLRAF